VKRGAVAELLGFSARRGDRCQGSSITQSQSAEWRISAVLGGLIGACWKEDVGRVGISLKMQCNLVSRFSLSG
jgi:hypothetical protein